MSDRTILRISGPDTHEFLQGLVTNDVGRAKDNMIYAALLTPQGKYLADFFLAPGGDGILLDVATPLAPGLFQRLSMYKLRADIEISETDLKVARGHGDAPQGAFSDPRCPALGWRSYGDTEAPLDDTALRIEHVVPETGIELTPDSYILEMGFERLNGVDFRKGCYVGQEVTARMKHKTTLRKGLASVELSGPATPGTEITSDGKPVGTLHTIHDAKALAYLRFDRLKGSLMAGDANVTLSQPLSLAE